MNNILLNKKENKDRETVNLHYITGEKLMFISYLLSYSFTFVALSITSDKPQSTLSFENMCPSTPGQNILI